jgi:hypothetical protein
VGNSERLVNIVASCLVPCNDEGLLRRLAMTGVVSNYGVQAGNDGVR